MTIGRATRPEGRMPRVLAALVAAATAGGCAMAKPSEPAAPSAQPAAPVTPPAASPPPPPPAGAVAPAGAQPGGGAGSASSRAVALQSASSEVDASQRELDVAAGDCHNACRALGSMDRAAGKVCQLAQGPDESRRCDDARSRVYSARDRVRSTCGACPGGPSLDRTAPIPSLR